MTTITLPRATVEQVLEALMDAQRHNYALKHKETDDLIAALRAALAQQAEPAQEPVAWAGCGECDSSFPCHDGKGSCLRLPLQQVEPVQAISECIAVLRPMVKGKFPHEQALDELVGYTAPPQRKPLTVEEIPALAEKAWKPSVYHDAEALLGTDGLVALVRAVEAKHNIKE